MKAPQAESAIRVSLGWNSSADDVERFVEAWSALRARARPGDVAPAA